MNKSEKRLYLIKELIKENRSYEDITIPQTSQEQEHLLRGLMNIRRPREISAEFLKIQDEYLREINNEKGIVSINDLEPICENIYLWQGDITTLKCDAIVNAANSGLTGCYIPNHRCIDNCIHSFAGIELRLECAEIMKKQGYEEPTGQAKITKAYNLPSKYVIHTVGPIVRGELTKQHCQLLKSCYTQSLQLAEENKLESIAFCCISTGEFHFPNDKACEIAVNTVKEYMKNATYIKKVIFNVFKEQDREIYEKLLRANR